MEREKFMQEARLTAHQILEGKENGIMNLVQRAWAEGKRNAEVETLRAAIEEALDRREKKEYPEDAIYPTWWEWFVSIGAVTRKVKPDVASELIETGLLDPIPADTAKRLGIEPKEG